MKNVIEWLDWLRHFADPDNLRKLANLGGHAWIGYAILFAIIFSETGLLVGFFLPGDSLLFSVGLLASQNVFDIFLLNIVLSIAAIVGDAVNFYLGVQTEERVFERGHMRFVKHSHLMAAKEFYEKHGGKAIVLARFVPLVRTFTPFVAGVAKMSYRRFAIYNIMGGIGWVASMTLAGYWLGKRDWVKDNFEKVVIGIVFLSLLPIFIGTFKHWRSTRVAEADAAEAS